MAQQTKIIDITKSYLPGDPNTFPMNLGHSQREDQPLEMLPIIPYDIRNMLPSSYGYRSYFGTVPKLAVAALAKPCDEIIVYQTEDYENILIALCSDGIYTLQGAAVVWTKSVAYTDTWTASGIYQQYTSCVIENVLYIYRQAAAKYVKILEDGTLSEVTPTFLNMSGQMGIFKANGRLGFWDSEDSVSWSSAFDLSDFTPALETMAGNALFLAVRGRIVTIKDHGDGFVIYATRSIIGVAYTTTGTLMWDASSITASAGVAHAKSMCYGETEKQHIVWTSAGIFTIGNQNIVTKQFEFSQIAPEIYDFLKESKDPIYLKMLAGRYLHFGLINANYLTGITLSEIETVDPDTATLIINLVPSNNNYFTEFALDYWTDEMGRTWEISAYDSSTFFSTNNVPLGEYCFAMQKGFAWLTSIQSDTDYPFTNNTGFWSGDHSLKFEIFFDKQDAAYYAYSGSGGMASITYDPIWLLWTWDSNNRKVAYAAHIVKTNGADTWDFYISLVHSTLMTTNTWHKALSGLSFQEWHEILITRDGTVNTIYLTGSDQAYQIDFGLPADLSIGIAGPSDFESSIVMKFNLESAGYPSLNTAIANPYHYVRNVEFYTGILPVPAGSPWSYPPATWLLQDGVPVAGYPTFAGSLVFDTQLKKWGKYVGDHKALIHIAPGNETSDAIIPYSNFGIDSGIVGTDGFIRLFDVSPASASISFGRIGLSRMGFTELYEVTAHFRTTSSGSITVQQSIDSKNLDGSSFTQAFTSAESCTLLLDTSAKWYSITISGNFDLTYLEFRGNLSSRR